MSFLHPIPSPERPPRACSQASRTEILKIIRQSIRYLRHLCWDEREVLGPTILLNSERPSQGTPTPSRGSGFFTRHIPQVTHTRHCVTDK